jgi:hypothetical protein
VKTDTPAAKEMAAKLAQMQAERDRQDGMWTQPEMKTSPENKETWQHQGGQKR